MRFDCKCNKNITTMLWGILHQINVNKKNTGHKTSHNINEQ